MTSPTVRLHHANSFLLDFDAVVVAHHTWQGAPSVILDQTAFYAEAIAAVLGTHIDIVTPNEPARRGCQLSLRVRGGRERGRALFEQLEHHGVLCDWREPDVIRVSPTPLYNRCADVIPLLRVASAFLN